MELATILLIHIHLLYVSNDLILRSIREDTPSGDLRSGWRCSFHGRRTSERQSFRVRKRACTHTKISVPIGDG